MWRSCEGWGERYCSLKLVKMRKWLSRLAQVRAGQLFLFVIGSFDFCAFGKRQMKIWMRFMSIMVEKNFLLNKM
ncbi:hypothetical protein DWZ40_05945 [Clostridium sp. AF32-12BH]|nr:hypothetical protein DWZ40_05945 [Clostridium sp. AF32-12BH]